MKVPVTIVVPVLNEAPNLPRCLKSVSWAEEIYVVDSKSLDGTTDIVKLHGAKIAQFDYKGGYPKKKNWALENIKFSHEWVLFLDADEVFSSDAEKEIMEICTTNTRGFDGYFINRRFLFMGKWLKHAYYPNWNLRLFKHKLGRYEKITDAQTDSGDVEIHEHVVLNGKAGYLLSRLDHYAFPTVEAFVTKHNRYSNWEAKVELSRSLNNITQPFASKEFNLRRKLKILSKHLPFRPTLRFIYVYILQRGFLDGKEGYYFARLHAFYEFLCVCKEYELRKLYLGRNSKT
ncbi:MAG: glycosyltransferase family 2 protein [Candidatus Omnitrophota bacterium]